MIKDFLLLIMTISAILSMIAITESQLNVYAGKDTEKELCEKNDGNWEDGVCDFKPDDEDKADEFLDDVQKIEDFEEEKADLEDALCDDPEDSEKFDEICKTNSDELTLGEAFAEKYNKKNCEENNGEWIDGECDFYENQMKEGWEVDEQEFYEKVCKDKEEESDECKKHRLSIEDGE